MSVLDKGIKVAGGVIVGLGVIILIGLTKKGIIKLPEFDFLKDNNNEKENIIEIPEEEALELLNDYQEYVSLIANEIKMSCLNHDISEIFASYVYLQENGYISFGNEILENENIVEISDNLGLNVATGEANAKNKVINFSNVLKEFGYDPKFVSGELFIEGKEDHVVNHLVCFIKEGGHNFLVDPANKTIFFKNGSKFVSMKDERVCFKPSFANDKEMGYFPDNKTIYFSLENCYKDCDWFILDYPYRENQAVLQDQFFKEYEENNLFDLERNIASYLEEFSLKYNSETEEKITLKLQSK